VRTALLCGLSLGGGLVVTRRASAEVKLIEKDGFNFFTDGRVNAFVTDGFGDGFPAPTPNPGGTTHNVVGFHQPFTAGYESTYQADANGNYSGQRVRSGFLANVLGFGIRRQVTETTTVTGYVALWGTVQTYARDRTQDVGPSTSKGFDVRKGYMQLDGPWGSLVAGRQEGLFGHISTEIDYLYAHNYGLGLPCLDDYYASCGHIGTGALGPGFAAGFVYSTPSLHGLRLDAGLYDPVRLLGAWERVPYPRPEANLSYERVISPLIMFKLEVEGMYQYMAQKGNDPRTDRVWGLAGGGRVEIGPLRLGASIFRGKGLGAYVALQNASSSFNSVTFNLRYFTGIYGQSALVFGRSQISLGLGEVIDDQLPEDKLDPTASGLKDQIGLSFGYYYSLTPHLAVGAVYFRFQADWWGAPNQVTDPVTGNTVIMGVLTPEKQVINFINVGATYHW
jgi:hypothetical protein